jgi:choline dehydrogenase-like flavoprotein
VKENPSVNGKENQTMNQQTGSVAVIGGGLAGLTAANYLARAGKNVLLFERSHAVGGRATTDESQGFSFNLGPHALYRNGSGVRILREPGVEFGGGIVGTSGAYALARGEKHTLPAGFVSLLTTGLMPLAARLELARMLGGISKINPEPLQRVTVREWLDREIRHPEVKELLQAVFRVATYTNAPESTACPRWSSSIRMRRRVTRGGRSRRVSWMPTDASDSSIQSSRPAN